MGWNADGLAWGRDGYHGSSCNERGRSSLPDSLSMRGLWSAAPSCCPLSFLCSISQCLGLQELAKGRAVSSLRRAEVEQERERDLGPQSEPEEAAQRPPAGSEVWAGSSTPYTSAPGAEPLWTLVSSVQQARLAGLGSRVLGAERKVSTAWRRPSLHGQHQPQPPLPTTCRPSPSSSLSASHSRGPEQLS